MGSEQHLAYFVIHDEIIYIFLCTSGLIVKAVLSLYVPYLCVQAQHHHH